MSEVLGLASSIISLESLGTKISKRLTSLPNDLFPTEDISNLVSDLWTTNQYLHELPEALQYFRSGSFITSISNDLRDILELLNDLSDTRKDRQKRSLASHGSQQDIASVRLRLIVVNRDLARIIE